MVMPYLTLVFLLYQFAPTHGLDCYNCTHISNASDCYNIVPCNSDEFCYTDTSGAGSQTHFTLGCRTIQDCRSASTTTMSPLSIIGRDVKQRLDCSQCCDSDGCNRHVCSTGTEVANLNMGNCTDDPAFNCQTVSTVFNICGDTFHAQMKCPKFCGFCDHPIVHGQWSSWQSWTSCSVSCGNGTKTRHRLCDNPAPQNGGLYCQGNGDETSVCNLRQCPVHGQWSRWSPWGICSVTCGIGLARRDRACSNPYPGPDGDPCWGDARDDRACFTRACSDGGWSQWSTWGSCSKSCLGGLMKRTRVCDNPKPSDFGRDCVGNNEDKSVCNNVECPVTNGHWSSWSGWSSCSTTCDTGLRRRTRTCTNPAPSVHGQQCIGNTEKVKTCTVAVCHKDGRNVRLNNARLEVLYNGQWGTVCDDVFNNNAAKVVCRMLGHGTSSAMMVTNDHTPDGSGQIWLDNVNCTGTEYSIFDCQHNPFGSHDCAHAEDVGVTC